MATALPDPAGPASPDLGHPGDPGLPRAEHLVLRAGDPPRRRPRQPRGLPHQHPRPASPDQLVELAARARAAHLLARAPPAASSSGCTRAPGSVTSPSTSRCSCRQEAGHDLRRGKTRAVKGRPRRLQRRLQLHRRDRRPRRRPAGGAPAQPPRRSRRTASTSQTEFNAFLRQAERVAFGPSTAAILEEAVSRDIPWIRLNAVLAGPARPGRPRPAHPGHDDVEDRRPRGRHRRRQGPHDQAARPRPACRCRAASRCARCEARSRRPAGSATPSSSSRSTATTVAACASTCERRGRRARRSTSPRPSRAAARVIVESFVTGRDYRCLIVGGRMQAIAERVPAHVVGDGDAHGRPSWSTSRTPTRAAASVTRRS